MPTAQRPKRPTARTDVAKKLGLDPKSLGRFRAAELTPARRAEILGVPQARLSSTSLVLTPKKPLSGKSYLEFFSAMMVLADPAPNQAVALFHPQFQGAVFPSVQVEFTPLNPGKKHLVEFHVTLFNPDVTYKFRVFEYPLAKFQDVSLSDGQVITALVSSFPDFSGSYGAAIQQRNATTDHAGWFFHRVKITTVS